jgi:hypothetical protein
LDKRAEASCSKNSTASTRCRAAPQIRHVRTNMILKEIKYEVALPF